MTEENNKNKEIFLNLCDLVWDLDEQSLNYVSNRVSDDWKPVKEFEALLNIPNSKYEDQRIRIDIDLLDPNVLTFFERTDNSFALFLEIFGKALYNLLNKYNCRITYSDFINNKVIFKKNQTKIKKVLEYIYAEDNKAFLQDANCSYNKEICAEWIVKKFEKIGASKKSAKKLQLVISFNPMDWLMSSTSETWSSCFNIDNSDGGYQYCLGLPFLCGDKNRMLLYITDGLKKECMGIKVDRFVTRTWCLLGDNDEFNIVKWYPNDTVGIEPVCSITGNSNFKNRESFKHSKYPVDVISTKKGAMIGVYSDMGRLTAEDDKLYIVGNGKDGQQIFTKNLIDCSKYNHSSFKISTGINTSGLGFDSNGYNIPNWKKFGLHIDMLFKTCKCNYCHKDRAGFFIDESFLCYECTKKRTYVCGCCGKEVFMKNENDQAFVATDIKNQEIKLCEYCFNDIKNFCGCCGRFSTDTYFVSDNNEYICYTCLTRNDGYATCSNCLNVSKNVMYYYNTFTKNSTKLCKKCKEYSNKNVQIYSIFGKYHTILKMRATGGDIE